MSIFAIANQKGGCGKTTTAINLSACLANDSHKILLIDLDPQAHATLGVGISNRDVQYSVYRVLNGSVSDIREMILKTSLANLDIVPSHVSLAAAEQELVGLSMESRLKEKLQSIRGVYDYVVIDCPPSLGALTVNALTSSDWVVIPVQTHYYALEGMKQLLYTIRVVTKRLNPVLTIMGVILNMHDRNMQVSEEVVEEMRDYFKELIFDTVIQMDERLIEASSAGEPIITYDIHSSGAREYIQLAQEVVERERKRAKAKEKSLFHI